MNTFRLELDPTVRVIVQKRKNLWQVVLQKRNEAVWLDALGYDDDIFRYKERRDAMKIAFRLAQRLLEEKKVKASNTSVKVIRITCCASDGSERSLSLPEYICTEDFKLALEEAGYKIISTEVALYENKIS